MIRKQNSCESHFQILLCKNSQENNNLRLYCDRDGIVWTSKLGLNGVYELLPYNPPVKRYAADPKLPGSLSNKNIDNILPGPMGKMWIGTADGLNIFDPETEKFEVLREKDLPGIKGPTIAPLYIDTVRQKAWLGAMIQKGAERVVSIYEMNLETRECRPDHIQGWIKAV